MVRVAGSGDIIFGGTASSHLSFSIPLPLPLLLLVFTQAFLVVLLLLLILFLLLISTNPWYLVLRLRLMHPALPLFRISKTILLLTQALPYLELLWNTKNLLIFSPLALFLNIALDWAQSLPGLPLVRLSILSWHLKKKFQFKYGLQKLRIRITRKFANSHYQLDCRILQHMFLRRSQTTRLNFLWILL